MEEGKIARSDQNVRDITANGRGDWVKGDGGGEAFFRGILPNRRS